MPDTPPAAMPDQPVPPQTPSWIEKIIDPDDTRRDSVSEYFFKNTRFESVVREAIQNSLDARPKGSAEPATVLLFWSGDKAVAGLPEVKGGRLPDDVAACSFCSPEDWFAEPLGAAFPDVSEREVLPPPGTRGSANHKFYWESLAVAAAAAAAD